MPLTKRHTRDLHLNNQPTITHLARLAFRLLEHQSGAADVEEPSRRRVNVQEHPQVAREAT